MTSKDGKILVVMTPKLADDTRAYAKKTGRSRSELIRIAVRQFMEWEKANASPPKPTMLSTKWDGNI